MALNTFPGVAETTSVNNRVYRATQSGTYTVDIKPGVYKTTRQATTNIIIGSTTITPSTTPSFVFITTPQTSITFNSTISQDTVPWVTRSAINVSLGDPSGILYDDTLKFYLLSPTSDPNEWALSTDAQTWVRFTQTLSENYFSRWERPVRVSTTHIMSVGRFSQLAGGAPVLRSTDGRGWSKYNISVVGAGNWNGLYCLAADPSTNMVVAGGLTGNVNGFMAWSTTWDGNSTWSGAHLMTSQSINCGTFGGGKFVFGGSAGTMVISTNGSTWTTVSPGFGAQAIRDVIYAQGKYVAVGATGIIRTSTDAITWNNSINSTFPTDRLITDIIFSPVENIFVAIAADYGEARISTDAVTWQTRTLPSSFDMRCMIYANNRYTIIKRNDTNVFTPYEVSSMLVTSPTVPFTDTYIILDFMGQIETLS